MISCKKLSLKRSSANKNSKICRGTFKITERKRARKNTKAIKIIVSLVKSPKRAGKSHATNLLISPQSKNPRKAKPNKAKARSP